MAPVVFKRHPIPNGTTIHSNSAWLSENKYFDSDHLNRIELQKCLELYPFKGFLELPGKHILCPFAGSASHNNS